MVSSQYGGTHWWRRSLPLYPAPTSQRAEITSIILALELALKKYETLDTNPYLDATVYTDSKYAVGCMTDWIYKWSGNGWINSKGYEVANRDLVQEASRLDDGVKELGDVEYVWIPRDRNEEADRVCNEDLDRQKGDKQECYSSDPDSDY